MNKEDIKLTEQEAPEKNTDAAFVKVGDDGKPVLPEAEDKTVAGESGTPQQGTLADR